MNSTQAYRTVAIFPIGLFGLSLITSHLHGPYYFGLNFDPEYAYLLNAVNIASFHSPYHVDHPGTTLQMVGAFVAFGR